MKTIKSYITAGATVALLFSSISCSKSFYTNANNNPNSPTAVTSASLLTGVEVSLAYAQGGASSQFTSMFTQQTFGVGRQAQAYYTYIFTPGDPEYLWDEMYTNVMENNYTLMQQAKAGGQNEYYAISSIIMAYSLQTLVDYWGNVPYSTAFQGAGNLQPTYDNAATLYNTTILNLVDTAIARLNNPVAGAHGQFPTSDDVIYGGSETKWIQFAYAIKARIYIHQCEVSNVVYEDSALAAVNASGALTGSFTNAVVSFGVSGTNNNPWFQFTNQRAGYISFAPTTLTDTMTAMNDPRDSIFADVTTTDPGYGSLGAYYGSQTSPVEFITTEELDFIAAEALVKIGGHGAAAQAAYTAGINANVTKLGVPAYDATPFLAGVAPLSATEATALHQVGIQQWIALYLNPEAWANWRRNNSPFLTPTAGVNGIVRRMIYPNSEQELNPNCPKGITLWYPQIFWDN